MKTVKSPDANVLTLELKISKMLRWGVIAAEVLMLLGWLSFLDFQQNPLLKFHDYQEEGFRQSLQFAFDNQQWGLLLAYAGLTVLIGLPLLRVLMTAILFFKQREKLLAALAFIVFIILILSFSLGLEL